MYFVSLKARNLFKIPAGNLALYFFNLNTTKMPLRDVCKMCSSIYFEAVRGRSHKALLKRLIAQGHRQTVSCHIYPDELLFNLHLIKML